jgi:hypothetical protein
MTIRRRSQALILAATLLAAALPITAAKASSAFASSLPGSSDLAVADGTVSTANGEAMAGVTVNLYAWPSDAVQKALKPGQLVPTMLLATATTNGAGKYMLMVPAARLKAAAVESGYANLEIFSATGGFWFFSYQTDTLPARPSAPVTADLSGAKKPPSCGLTPLHRPYFFTGFNLQRKRPRTWAVVGQGYIIHQGKRTAGNTVTFVYTEGSSHSQTSSLGVGISGLGFDAGYTGSGTHTSTAARSETYAPASGSTWFRTQFFTGQFRGICYGPAHDSNIPYQHQKGQCPHTITDLQGAVHFVHKCFWLIKSIGWAGGQSAVHQKNSPSTPAKDCEHHDPLDSFSGDLGTAVNWSAGFELGAALGIKGVNAKASFNGSAQTGYDANALMKFTFGRQHGGYLCGTNGTESTAAILVQRNNKP